MSKNSTNGSSTSDLGYYKASFLPTNKIKQSRPENPVLAPSKKYGQYQQHSNSTKTGSDKGKIFDYESPPLNSKVFDIKK